MSINKTKFYKPLKGILIPCLIALYPYLIYRSMENGRVWWIPALFSGFYFYRAINRAGLRRKVWPLLLAVLLLLGTFFAQTLTAKLLPVFIHLTLMVFFGRTLLKENGPPLIERFVRAQFPEYPPAVGRYCRRLTQIWTGFFTFNVVICTLLALWGADVWWAFYNGVVVYLLIGALAIGEYLFRRHYYFSDSSVFVRGVPGVKATFKTLFTTGRQVWLEMQRH